ncbi:MAG: 3-dehydroquinate dehydratase [Actinomycetales bacterium]|jgi:3-dehydroquinate dehydratase-2|nr:3-dehydroquinate dehydratase [Actinomycetales bacterium]
MSHVLILNGPNLGRLDLREQEIYGSLDYKALSSKIMAEAQALGLQADIRQSDDETEMIHWLHEAADKKIPVIINPAAFTHYSYAIRDAVAMVGQTVIEVHLSNPLSREEFRHTSVISGVAKGTISGFGVDSYLLALRIIAKD